MQNIVATLAAVLLFSFSAAAQINCTKNDCKNGYGEGIFPSGGHYAGEFRNGKLHGKGVLTHPNGDKYLGHWVNNYQEGQGRIIKADGGEYFGNFKAGRPDGLGKMTYANGNVYEGEWLENRLSGQGVMTFANGDRYEGGFKNDQFHGQGKMIYADGSRYEGEWEANHRQGLGTMYYKNGETINGQWEQDQYLANWSDLAFNGDTTLLRDCNLESCKSGKGKYSFKGGHRYIGDFRSGAPDGIGTVYFADGGRYEGGWFKSWPQGRGVMYYRDGRVLGAIWENGRPVHKLFTGMNGIKDAITVDRDPAVKIWAVIVGAARYTHMPTLRYTDDDAYQVFAHLKSPEGGALPDDQLRLLIDEDATHRNILQAMRSIFLRADENDVILFYFSGHGLQGSFLPVDYDGQANLLEHTEIRDLLYASKAKHKLVLADACHSGSLLAARANVTAELQRYYKAFEDSRGGTALLLSSKGEEYSLEDGGLRSGIFSHFLIRGLKGEADRNQDDIINIQELFTYVHQQVRNYTGNVQTPTLTGDYDANMPISVVRQ